MMAYGANECVGPPTRSRSSLKTSFSVLVAVMFGCNAGVGLCLVLPAMAVVRVGEPVRGCFRVVELTRGPRLGWGGEMGKRGPLGVLYSFLHPFSVSQSVLNFCFVSCILV